MVNINFKIKNNFTTNKYKLIIKLKRFSYFVLKYRNLLSKCYVNIKNKKSKKMHRLCFNKKNKLYLTNYLSYMELRISNIFFTTLLISKLELLKQLLLHGFIKINKNTNKSYNKVIHPYDIIGIDYTKQLNIFLVNRLLKNSIQFKYSLIKEFKSLLTHKKRNFDKKRDIFYIKRKSIKKIYLVYYTE